MRRDFGLQEEGSESENEPSSPKPQTSSSLSPQPHQRLTPPAPEAPNPPLETLRQATPLPSSPGPPTLDLTLPEVLDGLRQEEDSEGGEDGDVGSDDDSDVDSDGDEEEKVERWRREVAASRKWQEIEPRTVRTLETFKGLDKTELSFKPGALVTGVRPASWLKDDKTNCSRWLEGTLEGRVGLILESCVEYLPDQSDSD